MQLKTTASALFIILCFCLFSPAFVFAEVQAIDYLCEFGITFYRLGRYDDALSEFKKVLLLDPNNKTAREYINNIFAKESADPAERNNVILEKKVPVSAPPARVEVKETSGSMVSRDEAINQALSSFPQKEPKLSLQKEEKKANYNLAGVGISGETQLRLGFTPQNSYWKRANWDLNEKNFRVRSNTALDRRENTFDPRIYDRLRLNLDAGEEEGSAFYSNITVDPWSFTGKSARTTVFSDFGDSAQIELKYWSNTGYVINETINSQQLGNSFSLPEIKLYNEMIRGFDIKGAFTPKDTFHIPDLKIYRQFQPVRELWYDYNQDNLKLRIFPIAYENQSLTFDDPLALSNNRIWWEDSPWLHKWTPGIYNSGVAAPDFTKGYWDNTLSFFTRDSEGQRLTALRGFSFDFNPSEATSFATSIAAPKDLWQDYSQVDNVLTATRLKQSLLDNLKLGITNTGRFGYDIYDNTKLDAWNYTIGTDLGYEIIEGIKANFETAYSQSEYDITDSSFKSRQRGNAYHVSLLGRFPAQSIIDTENGYFGIQPAKDESFFTKFRLFAARMDDSFDASLSSYVETRDDEWWSRHLHFRQPLKYYYQGEGQLLTWDDIKNFGVGNGIDIGRSTFGLRVESLLWDKKVNNFFDVRNVHASNGKFVENVTRDEITFKVTDKLTTKALGIYQKMPKTKGGIDPFIFNPRTRDYYLNSYIEDGKDPSIGTGSLGAEYAFFDWLSLNGIWEITNDISLAYDNFPRGILESGERSLLFYEDGKTYRDVLNFLTDQEHFPRPPYPYYNIFKAGLKFSPMEKLSLYLDYTRNPYEKAGQVDDNMNHIGFELAYTPMPKFSFFFKYTYSRWQDLDSIVQNINKVFGHHNFFTEFIYRRSEDEDFTFQYGEASRNPYAGGVLDIGWDPFGGSLRAIDTQHIFRLYYRRKF